MLVSEYQGYFYNIKLANRALKEKFRIYILSVFSGVG